jgi:hypothetical protein
MTWVAVGLEDSVAVLVPVDSATSWMHSLVEVEVADLDHECDKVKTLSLEWKLIYTKLVLEQSAISQLRAQLFVQSVREVVA